MARRRKSRRKSSRKRTGRRSASSRSPVPARAVAHPSQPEHLKFVYATWVSERKPGRQKLDRLERAFKRGPLGEIPDIDHWAMEEFFWHGVPGDDWHPIEAYLGYIGERWSVEAREQFCRWKEARFGFFKIGRVRGETVTLREWDVVGDRPVGEPFPAITLGMGGVDFFRSDRGKLMLTYVAPWLPDENLYCSMGYGILLKRKEVSVAELLLGLRHPDLVAQPLPWKASPKARREYEHHWKERNWQSWLEERLEFPFRALIPDAPIGGDGAFEVADLIPQSAEEAHEMGVYLQVPVRGGIQVIGVTNVIVPDIASPNWMPIREYIAYRERSGPPPGVRNAPQVVRLE